MHNDFTKDEKAAVAILILYSFVWTILAIAHIDIGYLMSQSLLVINILFVGYMFFNRTIKFIFFILKNKKYLYASTCRITHTENIRWGRGFKTVYISEYTDSKDQIHNERIFRSFTLKTWEIGEQIKIKINSKNPEQIILVFSDLFTAIFGSIIGTIFEIILITLFINTL